MCLELMLVRSLCLLLFNFSCHFPSQNQILDQTLGLDGKPESEFAFPAAMRSAGNEALTRPQLLDKQYGEIMDQINTQPLSLILASTGSGKSTRVPLFILHQAEQMRASMGDHESVHRLAENHFLSRMHAGFVNLPHCRYWNVWHKAQPLIIGAFVVRCRISMMWRSRSRLFISYRSEIVPMHSSLQLFNQTWQLPSSSALMSILSANFCLVGVFPWPQSTTRTRTDMRVSHRAASCM